MFTGPGPADRGDARFATTLGPQEERLFHLTVTCEIGDAGTTRSLDFDSALERATGGELYIGASGINPTVREMGQAAVGPDGSVVAEDVEETRERLGAALADALLLDQQAAGSRARARLGWRPSRPTVLEELAAR